MVVLGPGLAQAALERGPGALGQVLEHVAFFVADTALDWRGPEDGPDRFAQRLGAINEGEDPLLGVEPALDQVAQERGRDRRVLG